MVPSVRVDEINVIGDVAEAIFPSGNVHVLIKHVGCCSGDATSALRFRGKHLEDYLERHTVPAGTLRLASYIFMLKEAPPRKGFLRDDQYAKLTRSCAAEGPWLRGRLEVGEMFVWRKGSVQTLKVGQIDFFRNTIRLEPDQTKNDEAAVAVMPRVTRELLAVCCADKVPMTSCLLTPVHDL